MPKNVKINHRKAGSRLREKLIKKPATKVKKSNIKPRKIDLKTAADNIIKVEQVRQKRDIEGEIENLIRKERDKRLILWTGVIFFMVLIFGFWTMNLQKVFTKVENKNTEEFNWGEITENFSNTVSQMKEDLSEIRSFSENEISTTTEGINLNQEEINELKKRLEALEGKTDNPFESNSATSSSDNEAN